MSAVIVTRHDGILEIRIDDAQARNRLTPGVLAGIPAALRSADADPRIKVCVLLGRPDVFCLGARQEDLLSLRAGRLTAMYADECVRGPLRCRVPVVAAMRGHAIGGGLLLGLFCDVLVLSERSVYRANFLHYGFTPCLGAAAIMTNRLGAVLGAEMLLTADGYQGRTLRERAAPVRVVDHESVEPRASELAARLAAVPRSTLEMMKSLLTRSLRADTDRDIAEELDMQHRTIRLPEIADRLRETSDQR
ncbi:polyketide synthase [Nocardia panacis]|nr:polyketide synthase [Nocardia panacis]